MTDRVSVITYVLRSHRIVLASIRRNDAKIIWLRTGSRRCIKKDDLVGCLNDFCGRSHSWHTIGLTFEDWIHGICVSVQVLNLIPELRLIEGAVGIHSSGELTVHSLVGLIATAFLVRSTSAGCDIRCDIAVFLGRATSTSGGAVPHTAQVRVAIRHPRSGDRMRRCRVYALGP